jgi:Undecaprenyl-phosphate glucose phosphotransferase
MKNRDNITFFFIGDIIASVLSFIIAYFSRFFWLTNIVPVYYGVPHFSNYIKIYFIFLVIFPIIFYLNNLYYFPRTRSKLDEVINIAVALFITVFLTFAVILYYRVYHQRAIDPAKALEPARIFIIYLFFISLILFSAIRLLIRKGIEIARKLGYQLQNVIIAGYSELSIPIAHILQSHKELGYNIVAFVDDAEPSTYQGIPVLNKLDNIVEYCQTLQVNTLITAFKSTEHEKLLKVLNATHNEMIEIKVVPDLLDYISLSTGIENLFGIPIINLNETPLKGINAVIKRIFDIIISSLALIILSPLFLIIAILIKLTSKGPVIYKQERISLDGAKFTIYKFRSMYVDAEKDTGPIMADPNDKRKTPIGAILRKLNLDELPQFYNVLKGDMSVVGPRPERPEFVSEFKEKFPQYMLRHKVKSGITGWAQINGLRGKSSIKKRLEYDLFYIENWSLLFDIKILLLSLFKAFKHAY